MKETKKVVENPKPKTDPNHLVKLTWSIGDKELKAFDSEQVEIDGAKWYLGISKTKDFVSVSLNCVRENPSQICDAKYTIFFRGIKKNILSLKSASLFSGDKLKTSLYHNNFTTWSYLTNAENGFTDEQGNLSLCAEIFVRGYVDLLAVNTKRDHFSSSTPFPSDCILFVEGKEVHVNKGLLSVYSPVFTDLFNADGFDYHQSEGPGYLKMMENVSYNHLVQLLGVIYPSHDPVTDDNVESLLKLASKFGISAVKKQCAEYLKTWKANFTWAEKLYLAQQYGIQDLENLCVNHYKTLDDLRQLEKKEIYKLLNPDVKIRLFEQVLKNT